MDKIVIMQEVWQDKDGNAVPYGDTRGASVLFGYGQHITSAQAKKYGISEDGKYQEPGSEDFPPTGKAMDAAPSNKAVEKAPRKK